MKFDFIKDLSTIQKVKRSIHTIVIHHSASPRNKTTARDIERWHLARGFAEIGYHFIILTDGRIQEGRPLDKIGAHVKGKNTGTIGICIIGNYSETDPAPLRLDSQFINAAKLVNRLIQLYPLAKIRGHRELAPTECPGLKIDMDIMRDYIFAVDELSL